MRSCLAVGIALVLACGTVSAQQSNAAAGESAAASAEEAPVVIPSARQFDVVSRLNGQTYRIMVATPRAADSTRAYPVLYVLDGNQYFGTASEALTRQSALGGVAPAIIVGIGSCANSFEILRPTRPTSCQVRRYFGTIARCFVTKRPLQWPFATAI